jgi:hypothetical protein
MHYMARSSCQTICNWRSKTPVRTFFHIGSQGVHVVVESNANGQNQQLALEYSLKFIQLLTGLNPVIAV